MMNKLQNEWRSPIIFILFILMIGALFLSRALLSVSMTGFVLFSFFHTSVRTQLLRYRYSPLLWGMSLLFLMPFVSGIWSEYEGQWLDIIRIKLPLLLLPLAFASPFTFSEKQWTALAYIFIANVAVAVGWTLYEYLPNAELINESYLRAKTMTTPLQNDHVRFSWIVAVATLLCGWICWQRRNQRDLVFALLVVIALYFVFFLHLLAARTGLFSFYLMLLLLAAGLILFKAKWLIATIVLLVVVLLPLAAYLMIPSFSNRVKYSRYEFDFFKHSAYLPGSNDAMRVVSLKTGFVLLQQDPIIGKGFGDIAPAMKLQYEKDYPGMQERDKILPASEWLMYGIGCGWPGLALFTIILGIPFAGKARHPVAWYLLNAIAAFSFLFDIGLEVQYGVFAYSFIVLWWWKWMIAEKI